MSPKLLAADKVKDLFPSFSLLERERKSSVYGSEVVFNGKIFLVRMGLKERGAVQLEGKNLTGDAKNSKFIEFLLVTFKEIL